MSVGTEDAQAQRSIASLLLRRTRPFVRVSLVEVVRLVVLRALLGLRARATPRPLETGRLTTSAPMFAATVAASVWKNTASMLKPMVKTTPNALVLRLRQRLVLVVGERQSDLEALRGAI